MSFLAVVAGGYLIGSFPTAVIVGRIVKGVDVREHGSGNAGATNVVRVLGFWWGLFVALLDIGKGALPVFVAQWAVGSGVIFSRWDSPVMLVVGGLAAGIGALVGHALPVFAGFRGGKGVATGAGMVLALWPLIFVFCLSGFLLGLFLTGFVSVGSLTAAIVLPTMQGVLLTPFGPEARAEDQVSLILGILVGALVIFLHRKNIHRLIHHYEKRFDKIWILRPLYSGKTDRNGETNNAPDIITKAPLHDDISFPQGWKKDGDL